VAWAFLCKCQSLLCRKSWRCQWNRRRDTKVVRLPLRTRPDPTGYRFRMNIRRLLVDGLFPLHRRRLLRRTNMSRRGCSYRLEDVKVSVIVGCFVHSISKKDIANRYIFVVTFNTISFKNLLLRTVGKGYSERSLLMWWNFFQCLNFETGWAHNIPSIHGQLVKPSWLKRHSFNSYNGPGWFWFKTRGLFFDRTHIPSF
jgi:hypothetical protein